MHLGGAAGGGKRGAGVSHRQMRLRESRQCVHLVGGLVRVAKELHRVFVLPQGGDIVAGTRRQPAVTHGLEKGEAAVLMRFDRHRGSFSEVSAGGVQMPHLDFVARQLPCNRAKSVASTRAPYDVSGLKVEAAGSPVQPEFAVSDAQIARNGALTLYITRRLEGGERLT